MNCCLYYSQSSQLHRSSQVLTKLVNCVQRFTTNIRTANDNYRYRISIDLGLFYLSKDIINSLVATYTASLIVDN